MERNGATAEGHETRKQREPRYSNDRERWAAVRQRDASADGAFYYSVKSTGIYCRPGCASRLPRREHVAFHASSEEAEQAGFRPCKRCCPGRPPLSHIHAGQIARACRLMESGAAPASLQTLAQTVGMSRFHFHRVFTMMTGLTPKAYALASRAERFRAGLQGKRSITDAMYEAGFTSSSRLYEKSDEWLGMPARSFRDGGKGEIIRFAIGPCPLGSVLAACSSRGVCAILLGDSPEILERELRSRFPKATCICDKTSLARALRAVIALVEMPGKGFPLPLDLRGTAFQRRVWRALQKIPHGKTSTYSAIAQRIGRPKSVRAVAGACGANPLAVAVPCHRVVRSDGSLSGYRWGLERKRKLLSTEARSIIDQPEG